MSSKTIFKAVAGAMALALSTHAFSQVTTADTAGTIFLSVDVTSGANNNAAFLFDTGLSVASFNGTSNFSKDLSTDSNFQSFLTAVGSLASTGTQFISYSIIGGYSNGSGAYSLDYSSSATTAPSEGAGNIQDAIDNNVAPFLATVLNPKGATSYYSASADSSGGYSWVNSGTESNVGSDITVNDNQNVGTKLYFYQLATTNAGGQTANSPATKFAGTWLLTTSGLLTYTASAVPLPAPLVLLLSGLGLMGLIARRGSSRGVNGAIA